MRLSRLPRLLVTALVVGLGISQLLLTLTDWHLSDAAAYWEAAQRLRDGEPLYPPLADTEASDVYRYAPWFAFAWVPLTLLGREAAYLAWSLILVAASFAALIPLVQRRAWLLVAFFGPILIGISGIGNVQPLIVAALVLGIERRSGPLWIGLAASLKAVPLLLAVTYAGRGEWWRASLAVLVTVLMVAPMLLYDLADYPTGANAAGMLINVPALYAGVIALGVVASARLARGRFAWLVSSTTMALALPRFFVYDLTFLMPSLPALAERERTEREPDHRVISGAGVGP